MDHHRGALVLRPLPKCRAKKAQLYGGVNIVVFIYNNDHFPL